MEPRRVQRSARRREGVVTAAKFERTRGRADDPELPGSKKSGPGFLRGPTLCGARCTSDRTAIRFHIVARTAAAKLLAATPHDHRRALLSAPACRTGERPVFPQQKIGALRTPPCQRHIYSCRRPLETRR